MVGEVNMATLQITTAKNATKVSTMIIMEIMRTPTMAMVMAIK